VSEPVGILSIVSTPIGNLEDITLRALRILREADVVLAEDTRRTRGLCQAHGIACTLRSYHAHTDQSSLERIVEELATGKHFALVSDAGTPLLSDPGAALVQAAHARGIKVQAIPGASALMAALAVSGLAVDQFRFVGFLPRSGKRRREALDALADETATSVVFESPQRLGETLQEFAELLGPEREVAVCRELTKLHEEVVRGSAQQLATHFGETARGEIVLLIAGRGEIEPIAPSDADLDERIAGLLASGTSARDAASLLAAQTGLRRQVLYARVQAWRARSQPDHD
jgi:16S rRNA (cytidine1402-2'-O)-methyltransferase